MLAEMKLKKNLVINVRADELHEQIQKSNSILWVFKKIYNYDYAIIND
jgi:hypothetical protein